MYYGKTTNPIHTARHMHTPKTRDFIRMCVVGAACHTDGVLKADLEKYSRYR
ncbi:hypothetical protein [Leeuwenhoekiella marinoflava]|uniref:hypothetical protein n=1 Tax=Leeuwenhoekiella marinoflava TaxID=988 RepID=UPI0030015A8C